jgi:hypothetical protein
MWGIILYYYEVNFTIKGGNMNRKKILSATFILMFLLVSFWLSAEESKSNPVAVSPGSETEPVSVWQSCPTFSWSAVEQASSYRIAVFEVVDPLVMEYESMAAMISPVISKDIPGPALSWTLSSEESLKTGSMYTWYVQAVDAYGNALGRWSNGRIFKVKQELRFVGTEEKLGEILKSYGVSEVVINGVLNDMDGDLKEVVVREAGSTIAAQYSDNRSGIQGTEGPTNTFYGLNAGDSITTGKYNSFFGREAGEFTTSGELNTFLG